jgi:hypothetical protein
VRRQLVENVQKPGFETIYWYNKCDVKDKNLKNQAKKQKGDQGKKSTGF